MNSSRARGSIGDVFYSGRRLRFRIERAGKGCPVKQLSTTPQVQKGIAAHVTTWGTVRAMPEDLAQWRKQPKPFPFQPYSPALLKHSEEQTVAGLWAVCEATSGLDQLNTRFANWGVVAAPRFYGRTGNATSLQRYKQEGALGISPHMIPHHS